MLTANTSQGLGDTVAKVTRFFGIEPCGGCNQRKELLNRWFPYQSGSSQSLSIERDSLEKNPPERTPVIVLPQRRLHLPVQQRREGYGDQLSLTEAGWGVSERIAVPQCPYESGSGFPIVASSVGWREPDRRGGPLDWEGDRRHRRGDGSRTSPSPGTGGTPVSYACGVDVTEATKGAIRTTKSEFGRLSDDQKHEACGALHSLFTGEYAWDIIDLHRQVTDDQLNAAYRPVCATSGASPACGSSVTIGGSCHFAGSANYVIFGIMCKLCHDHYQRMLSDASWYEIIDKDTWQRGSTQFSLAGMLGLIDLYKKYVPLLTGDAPAGNIEAAKRWSIAGWNGWPHRVATPQPDRANCTLTCPHRAAGPFTVSWHPFLNPYSRR